MYLAGMLEPDFRRIADFRKDHLHQIKEYFRRIVEIAVVAGVSSFARISIDGSKIKANASKKGLKTEEKLDELIEDVERQIADHLEKAVQTDEEEDKKYGEYADETSKELAQIGQENFKRYIKQAKERLEKLDQAKKELGRRKGLMKADPAGRWRNDFLSLILNTMPKKMNAYVLQSRECSQESAKPATVDPAQPTRRMPVPVVPSKKSASLPPTNPALENFTGMTKNIWLKRCGRLMRYMRTQGS